MLLLAAVAVVVPAALLSAVPPMVVKLQLARLSETGAVVGRLSGIGTLGGIAATFGTGFLLLAVLPSSVILVGTGALTVVAGVAVGVLLRRRTGGGAGQVPVGLLVLAVSGAGLAAVAPTPCDEETAYHCGRVVAARAGLRSGADARHAAALLRRSGGPDPPRVRVRPRRRGGHRRRGASGAAALGSAHRRRGPHGAAVPRRDPTGLAEEPGGTRDLVVGDAFGGLSVLWQLTTREAPELVDAALTDGGVYVVNLIDHPPLDFVRAELATLQTVFPHVLLLARAPVLAGEDGGNVVAVASRAPLPSEAIAGALTERDLAWQVADGSPLAEFVGAAAVLTDDFAPVDQLLTPYG